MYELIFDHSFVEHGDGRAEMCRLLRWLMANIETHCVDGLSHVIGVDRIFQELTPDELSNRLDGWEKADAQGWYWALRFYDSLPAIECALTFPGALKPF